MSKFESILKSVHSASEALKMEIDAVAEASMCEGYALGMRRTDAIAVTQIMLSIGKVSKTGTFPIRYVCICYFY